MSSDNFFNTIGLNLWYGRNTYGEDALQNVAKEYGLGAPTGIALPNEAPGKIPTPQSYLHDHQQNPSVFTQAQWYPGNSDQVAIGQDEVLVTPLQLANAYATFANGGNLLVPQLALDAANPASRPRGAGLPHQGAAHASSSSRTGGPPCCQGFTGVVNNPFGTAYGVFANTPLATMDIAGKTGTAQVNAPRQDTSVFTSFAPASQPPVRGGRLRGGRRLRSVSGGPGGAGDLRRALRPASPAGGATRAPAAEARTDAHRLAGAGRGAERRSPCSGSTSIPC